MGFTSFASDFSVASLKSQIPVTRVEGFSGTDIPHRLKVLTDSGLFSAGDGYWVKADADGILIITS
jgi:hypothetical protein